MDDTVPSRGLELLAVDAAFMTAAVFANALRCYVRITMVKGFGGDDWLMAIATVTGVHYGTGRHHHDLPTENIQRATNYWWFCYLFYCISMITSKLSIGWFLLRISINKVHSWIIYAAMSISVVAGAVFFFVTLFQCQPISYFWNKDQPGTCISIEVIIGLGYLYSTFSIISDFTFAIIPAFLVWTLQLKPRTKVALVPLLTMGCIASSAVIARVPYLASFRSPDFLWATLDIAIWSTVEQGLAITAGSLATLRPLFHLISHRLGLTTNSDSHLRPSRYGAAPPSASQMLGGRRRPSQDILNHYNLSSVAEAGCSKDMTTQDETALRNKSSPNWFQSTRQSSISRKKSFTDSDSQESLHGQSSKQSLGRDDMQIMVSKSFSVRGEHR